MFTAFLWAGTGFLALALGFFIYRDIRFRSSGRLIEAVARVVGYREGRDDDGFTVYFHRLAFTDHRGVEREISHGFSTRQPRPIGTQVRVRYPETRPDLARERDGGCLNVFSYAVVITMLCAFAAAAMLGFGADL